jgi:hypothetical protein
MNPAYVRDEDAELPEENKDFHTLKIGSKRIPGLDGFWSVDLHNLAPKLTVADAFKHYRISSQMVSSMKKDNDEGFTIYRQKYSPGTNKENEAVSEPSPQFIIVIRLSSTDSPIPQQDWLASLVKQMDIG